MQEPRIEAARDDRDLLLRFADRGDRGAFDALVARHKDALVRFCARFLGDYHRGEEIAQETFLRVYRHAGAYDPMRDFRTWMFSIAGNLCRNELRDRRSEPLPAGELGDRPALPAGGEGEVGDAETETVRRAFSLLTEEERQAVVLRIYHQLSYEEIARAMDAPLNTVRSWLRRGRLRLKDFWERRGEP